MHYLPDPAKAVLYSDIINQLDHQEATAHYVAAHFGADVATQFLNITHEVWRLILAGYIESQCLETITAMFGFPPLSTGAPLNDQAI